MLEELREALIKAINSYPDLPLDCKYYVVADVFHEIDNLYHNALKNQKEVNPVDNTETQCKSDTERDKAEG